MASGVTESETSTKNTVHTFSALSVRAMRASDTARAATNATRNPSDMSCCCHGRPASDRGRMRSKSGATRRSPMSFGERRTYVVVPRAHDSVESGELHT
jgi:hypothetical protein